MRIKLTCCCGATIDIEESFAPTAQQMAGVWLERHADCHAAPECPPSRITGPFLLPGTPGTPVPPWNVTCTFVDEDAHG